MSPGVAPTLDVPCGWVGNIVGAFVLVGNVVDGSSWRSSSRSNLATFLFAEASLAQKSFNISLFLEDNAFPISIAIESKCSTGLPVIVFAGTTLVCVSSLRIIRWSCLLCPKVLLFAVPLDYTLVSDDFYCHQRKFHNNGSSYSHTTSLLMKFIPARISSLITSTAIDTVRVMIALFNELARLCEDRPLLLEFDASFQRFKGSFFIASDVFGYNDAVSQVYFHRSRNAIDSPIAIFPSWSQKNAASLIQGRSVTSLFAYCFRCMYIS